MPDAQTPHAGNEFYGCKSAIVIGLQTFGFAEDGDQLRYQRKYCGGAFLADLQRQITSSALINYTDQNMRSLVDMHIGKIQSPRLVCFLWSRWFLQRFAQLHNLIFRALAQVGDIGLANRFAPSGKGGIEGGGNRSTTFAAHDRDQAKHFGDYPCRFWVRLAGARCSGIGAGPQARLVARLGAKVTPVGAHGARQAVRHY